MRFKEDVLALNPQEETLVVKGVKEELWMYQLAPRRLTQQK
jgi:hypothetical protein